MTRTRDTWVPPAEREGLRIQMTYDGARGMARYLREEAVNFRFYLERPEDSWATNHAERLLELADLLEQAADGAKDDLRKPSRQIKLDLRVKEQLVTSQ